MIVADISCNMDNLDFIIALYKPSRCDRSVLAVYTAMRRSERNASHTKQSAMGHWVNTAKPLSASYPGGVQVPLARIVMDLCDFPPKDDN